MAEQTNISLSDSAIQNLAGVLGNINITLVDLKRSVDDLSKKIDSLTTQLAKRE